MVDVMQEARKWLAENFLPPARPLNDKWVEEAIEEAYPTGFEGFHEDITKAYNVS